MFVISRWPHHPYVPASSKEGDWLCMLDGAAGAVILRPTHHDDTSHMGATTTNRCRFSDLVAFDYVGLRDVWRGREQDGILAMRQEQLLHLNEDALKTFVRDSTQTIPRERT